MGLFSRRRQSAATSAPSSSQPDTDSKNMAESKLPYPPADAPPSYEQSVSHHGPTASASYVGYPKQQDSSSSAAPPPMASASVPVIVQYVNAPNFGPHSVNMVCPHCQCQIATSTDSEPGPMAWILAGILCIVGLWPCACIPCCIDSLNSVTHKCPQCKNFLGRYKGGM